MKPLFVPGTLAGNLPRTHQRMASIRFIKSYCFDLAKIRDTLNLEAVKAEIKSELDDRLALIENHSEIAKLKAVEVELHSLLDVISAIERCIAFAESGRADPLAGGAA